VPHAVVAQAPGGALVDRPLDAAVVAGPELAVGVHDPLELTGAGRAGGLQQPGLVVGRRHARQGRHGALGQPALGEGRRDGRCRGQARGQAHRPPGLGRQQLALSRKVLRRRQPTEVAAQRIELTGGRHQLGLEHGDLGGQVPAAPGHLVDLVQRAVVAGGHVPDHTGTRVRGQGAVSRARRRGTSRPMDATELLMRDHATVRRLAETFEKGEDDKAKAEAVAEILALLKVHTAIEEEIFYPAVRTEVGEVEDLVLEGVEEHHVAKELIAEIEGLKPADEAWEPKVTVLIENVEHHVEEEESEMFPKVRKGLDAPRLAALGQEMALRRNALQYDAMTRDALYALARERGVPGRSDMTKPEIVDALVGADRA
jgi:hemerythrin-like domain-containing protein